MADGSLRDSTETESEVPQRFGILCGHDVAERRRLSRELEALRSVRNAIAYGRQPTRSEIRSFLGAAVDSDAGDAALSWIPSLFNPRDHQITDRAMSIIRSLYRAWLLASFEVVEGVPRPRLPRADLLEIVRAARRNDTDAREKLAAIVS
jgi:hypothetical protein